MAVDGNSGWVKGVAGLSWSTRQRDTGQVNGLRHSQDMVVSLDALVLNHRLCYAVLSVLPLVRTPGDTLPMCHCPPSVIVLCVLELCA